MKLTKEEIEEWTPGDYAEIDIIPPGEAKAVFIDPDKDSEIIGYEGIDYSYLFPDEEAPERWLSGEEGLKLQENKIRIKKSQIRQAIMEALSGEAKPKRGLNKLEMGITRLLNTYTVTDIFDKKVDYKQLFYGLKADLGELVKINLETSEN